MLLLLLLATEGHCIMGLQINKTLQSVLFLPATHSQFGMGFLSGRLNSVSERGDAKLRYGTRSAAAAASAAKRESNRIEK